MRAINRRAASRRPGTALLLALGLVALLAMQPGFAQGGPGMPLSVADDWTHHHVVFSGARSEAAADRLRYEPRYLRQWLVHSRPMRRHEHAPDATKTFAAPTVGETFAVPGLMARFLAAQAAAERARKPRPEPVPPPDSLDQDWASALPAGAKVGNGMFPAKFTFDVTAPPDCTNDYVVFNTGLTTGPSIVAYNNLYSTQSPTLQGYCGGGGPTVRWAYRTGTGAVVASTVLSLDGTKVVYVSTQASGAVLHVLQLNAAGEGTVAAPVSPTAVTNWGSCAAGASCVVNVPFTGAPQSTRSAPFYDYTNDVAYAGDDAGRLHMFTPVLSGTPAEVTTGGWPVTVDAGFVLNGPVLDPGTNRVFLTTNNGTNSKVCYVTSTPAVTCTANLAGLISDAVTIDSSAGKVFAFSTVNGATVHQYSTALASPVAVRLGGGTNVAAVYSGAFNHAYLTSPAGTGKLYVCGKGATGTRARLFRLSITNGTMSGAADTGNVNLSSTASAAACSPVAEFYNASTGMDWIFVSVGNNSVTPAGSSCATTTGCVMSLNVTGTAWPPTGGMTAGYAVPSNATNPATSGIVVDNTGGSTTVPATTLAAAITSTTATSITVASSAGFAVNDYVQIDAEAIRISAIAGTTLTVVRAQLGTTAATHLISTAVVDLRSTLLNGAITAAATSITVDSTTTFNVNDYIQVDSEAMLIMARPSSTTLTVTRGRLGSTAAAHADNARVNDLSGYPQAASVYFSFGVNSSAAVLCNGTNGVGCAVKLTQDGLR